MKGRRTVDRVNDRVLYMGLSPGVLVFMGGGGFVGFMLLTSYLKFYSIIPIIIMFYVMWVFGEKTRKRLMSGDYHRSKSLYDFNKSKKLIVDFDDILSEM